MKDLGIDYETYLIGEPDVIPKPVCLSYCDHDKKTGLIVGMDNMENFLKQALSDITTNIIAHNCTFEILVTYKYFPKLRPLIWEKLEKGQFFCTQLQQKLLDNVSKQTRKSLKNHNLATLMKHYFKLDLSDVKNNPDAWRLRYKELDGVPLEDWPQEAIDYAVNDSIYTLDIKRKQLAQNDSLEQKEHLKASVTLNLMAARGIKISKERVETLETEVNEQLFPVFNMLISKGFMRYDKKDSKYKKEVKLLQQYISDKFKILMLTNTKKVATSKEAFDLYLLEDPEDEVIQSFRFILNYEKIKSGFIVRLKTADPYIYTSYNPLVTTGRTSSFGSKFYPSVNIQNQPRGI